jgi:cytosine/adenosine deaminase-related metal-dependent hydrolase
LHPSALIVGGKFTLYQSIILYRKIKANSIFTGTQMLSAENVLITTENGNIQAIVDVSEAGDDVENFEGILTPGFINSHCHIELSHMKGKIPEKTGLVNFVQQVMGGRQANELEKNEAMQAAAKELFNSGTVAIGDICNNTDSISFKKDNPLYWHNFIEISGFIEAAAEKRLQAAEEILDVFKTELVDSKQFSSTLSPHAPYSVSKKLFHLLNEKTAHQLISIHNQEALAENELYKNKSGDFLNLYKNFGIDIVDFSPSGKTSLQTWLPYFTNEQTIILVHNTFTTQQEIATLSNKLYFCICINANLYIEDKLPPIEMLFQANQAIILGTDSYASNWHLNIYEEIKTIQNNFPAIPFQNILQWATLNGAKALGIQDEFGSFEKGKTPGIVLINKNKAERIL